MELYLDILTNDLYVFLSLKYRIEDCVPSCLNKNKNDVSIVSDLVFFMYFKAFLRDLIFPGYLHIISPSLIFTKAITDVPMSFTIMLPHSSSISLLYISLLDFTFFILFFNHILHIVHLLLFFLYFYVYILVKCHLYLYHMV